MEGPAEPAPPRLAGLGLIVRVSLPGPALPVPDLRAVGIPIAYSVSIFCFAFSIPDQRNLVRTHWNYCKVIEGWAWTRLQYKHNPLRPIKPQWKLRLVAIGHRSLLNAAVRLVGDDILLLFFPFTQGFQRLLFNADTLHQ